MVEEVDWRQQYYQLEREYMAVQEMLAHTLSELGSPVRVNKDDLVRGKFQGKRILISEDDRTEQFVISLVDE